MPYSVLTWASFWKQQRCLNVNDLHAKKIDESNYVHKFYMYVDNSRLDNLHVLSLLWALWLQPAESNVCVS